MEHASTFVGDLALVLVVAAATSVVFRLLRQPVVLGYLLAGLIVGPYIPIPLFADAHRVEALAEFGVVLVMFSVGLEFSFRRLARVLPAVGLPALIQMSTLAWLGMTAGGLLGWSRLESVFLGACLAVSSTMVVVRAIDEVDVPRPAAELALGILVTQDLVAILVIAALTAIATGAGLEASELLASAGELTLFLVGLVVIGLLLVPRLVRWLMRIGNREIVVVAVTGICFGLALLAERMGYSVALGAFVAGSLVAGSGEEHAIEKLVQPLRDLFAAVFFVAIGMAVDPRQVLEHLHLGLVAVGLIVAGQLVSVTVGGTLAGRGLPTSVRAGAALGQIGEFSFIIASLGVATGVVRPALYAIVVIAALVTTFTTTVVLRISDRIALGIDHLLPPRVRTILCLYPSWLDQLTARARAGMSRTRSRRLAGALVLDTFVLVALTVLYALAEGELVEGLSSGLGLDATWAGVLVAAGTVLLAFPFVLGALRSGRRLGDELAQAALPPRTGVDLAAAPRRTLRLLLELLILLAVGVVYVLLTQPFVQGGWFLMVLAMAVAGFAVTVWRASRDLEGHVQAGAQAFAAALLAEPEDEEMEDIERILPGLGDLVSVPVTAASPAAGRSLAELELRGRTGVTVLAVRRGEQVHSLPGGDWVVQPGDFLGLTGSTEAVGRAREVLG